MVRIRPQCAGLIRAIFRMKKCSERQMGLKSSGYLCYDIGHNT
ncbi:MAG: hypothetical protein Q4E91_11100 [Lachnospiraceae bacterium]|nr:hypothetical protein [Lachnospiraceae bacterium]